MKVLVRFRFEAAHRLSKHIGKCRNLHGHSYCVDVGLGRDSLDEGGMVVDFAKVSSVIGRWVEENWDHAVILNREDREFVEFMGRMGMKVFLIDGEPTVENMTKVLLGVLYREFAGMNEWEVRMWEGEDSWVEVSKGVGWVLGT